ncbi:MAG: ABC transporter ATP-binding protein [Nitrospirota bacterium]|nr:ABC transporter ATP-binding protein [Nitrospirota bacterium]MDE3049582.1 ABC transporter ATP-binding protein [Nitrospirota bacterium]
MSPLTTAIRASELTKHFPGVLAVDHLSFEVPAGEIFGLVGPDGAGKTTTLRMLAGVLTPDSGSATVAGVDIVRESEAAKPHISYMPQRFGLYEDLTVGENIRFYADVFGVSRTEREQRARQLLEAAAMSQFENRLAGKLSGGMKQKLGLVCALIHRPHVILLDEPTNGVDPVSRRDFWHILYSLLGENIAIVMSTAYLDEAERCHRVALLHQGRILFSDTPSQLKKHLPVAVVAVVSPSPRLVQTLLANAEGVLNVVLGGDGVHLVVDDAERRIPELRRHMVSAALPFQSIEHVAPSIEDLFVAATSGGDGGGER